MERRHLIAALAAAALSAAPAAAQTPAPADPGGFWSLLAVGQGQTVNATDLAGNLTLGTIPASFQNQRALFEHLPALAPNVTAGDLPSLFKRERFGVAPGELVSTEQPRAGVTIERDTLNVPHVYGTTRSDVMWGAGYVNAADRLFFMEVLRRTARGRLTTLIGPGANGEIAAADAAQLEVTDYTDAELREMIERTAAASAEGAQVVHDLHDYVAGVNAYIDAARNDPRLMPSEYAALGASPAPWTQEDTAAVLSLINGYFGRGGGVELDDALAYAAARARFGRRKGDRVIADFRALDDPEAPVTTTRRFPFDDPGKPSPKASAIPDAGSVVRLARVRNASSAAAAAGAPGWLTRLRARGGVRLPRHASNAMAIPARESSSGRPLLVAGPQVDFYSPEIFSEVDLHGGGIDERGATLPGLGLYVLIGRGREFAWSITTAQGDNTDVFAEKLCEPNGGEPSTKSTSYLHDGHCLPMEIRDDPVSWQPGPADLAADPTVRPYSATMHTERTLHGPVIARATVHGAPVAYALARASYRNELDGAAGFARLAANAVSGPRGYMRAAATSTGSFNWLFVDRRHAAYYQSGRYPLRARGTDPSLPAWGTGRWDWRGFDPRTFTSKAMRFSSLPHDTDPRRGYLVSWNNKQAPGWRASDYDWEYGPVHRSQRLERRVRSAIRGARKLDLPRLVGIMGDAATVDVRGQEVGKRLLDALGRPADPAEARAAAALRSWVAAGSHRIDRNHDGAYDESLAVAVMDAWWTPMVRAIFEPRLGAELVDRIAHINPIDYLPVDGPDTWFYGWMGYVQRDLRALAGRRIAQPPSRVYCGGGSRARCRELLQRTFSKAVATVASRYGSLDAVRVPTTCAVTDPPGCDQLDFIASGAVETPPTPWQDRGTYQQAVEVGAP